MPGEWIIPSIKTADIVRAERVYVDALGLAVVGCAPDEGGAQTNGWLTFRGDAAQTGAARSPLADQLDLLWTYEAEDPVESTAAIADGTVYVGTDAGKLLALDLATGTLKWEYTAEDAIRAAPAVRDGRVFVGTERMAFWVLKAGREKEVLDKGRLRSMAITAAVAEGTFYLPTQRRIFAVGIGK